MVHDIKNKSQMRKLYYANEFGNRWPAWSLSEYISGGLNDIVGLMYNGIPGEGSKFPHYCEPFGREDIIKLATEWVRHGANFDLITASACDNNVSRLVQGEITLTGPLYRFPVDIELYISAVNKIMKHALAEGGYTVNRHEASQLLLDAMDRASFANLRQLFFRWPDHIVEFTCYPVPVGILRLNTVFWEVRKY